MRPEEQLRERIRAALQSRHATESVRVTTNGNNSWSACVEVGAGHERTAVSWRDSELDALTSLAVALGLDADGSDPRDTIVTLTAERDAALADAQALRLAAREFAALVIDNAPTFGTDDHSLREHAALCKKTAHALAVLSGARGPR